MGFPSRISAVVTGAGGGLGEAFALEIVKRGGRVVVADLKQEAAERTVEQVKRLGGEAWATTCDVRDLGHVEALRTEAERQLGEVNLVINNAGVAVGGLMETVSIDDWRWIVDVNLWGVIYGCHVFYPRMKARGEGAIINVASAAGLLCPPDMAPYNTTKAAVVALSETLYAEAKNAGVNVTVLCPTFFKTGLLETARGNDEASKSWVQKQMERSKVQAPDVARAALDAVKKGKLYSVPMRDGKMAWRFKRATPQRFYDFLAGYAEKIQKRRAK